MKLKRYRATVTGFVAVGLLISACSATEVEEGNMPDTPPASSDAAPEPEPEAADNEAVEADPVLATELADLIREDLPPLHLHASSELSDDCEHEAGGCYVHDESAIYVDTEIIDFRRPELLAHEYLHYVWERDNLEADSDLVAALQEAYENPEGLAALIPSWQNSYFDDDGNVVPTELFSYACTGLRTDQLPKAIGEQCETYLDVDALPINQNIDESELLTEIDSLRREKSMEGLADNPNAAAASLARAELFTSHSQVPLNEYPESVRQHLDAGCAPAKYGTLLTRPHDVEEMTKSINRLLDDALISPEYASIGIATNEFDYIDASQLFDDRAVQVNATLVVVTVCQ